MFDKEGQPFSVRYENLHGLLLRVIQSQNGKLESQNARLESQNAQLENHEEELMQLRKEFDTFKFSFVV